MQRISQGSKKLLALVLAATMLCFGALVLSSCGKSDEEVVREGVVRELDLVKNKDPEFMESITDAALASEMDAYGIDANEFMVSYLEGFDYTINDVTVDGDGATANVTITCKTLTDIYNEVMTNAEETANNTDTSSMSEDEANQLVGQIMMEAVGQVQATTQEPIDLTFTLNGNTWEPTSAAETALQNALFGA